MSDITASMIQNVEVITASMTVNDETVVATINTAPRGPAGNQGPQGSPGPNTVTTNTQTAFNGILKGNGSTVGTATAGTDYLAPSGNGSGLTGLVSSQITDATSTSIASTLVLRGFDGEAYFGSQTDTFLGDGVASQAYSGNAISGQSVSGSGVYAESNSGAAFYGYGVSGDLMKLEGASGVVLTVSNSGNITAPSISGNAATATKLAASKNIFGIAFDGSGNVSGDATNAGHFASIPTGGNAGHFVTLNGTAPSVIAGRSAWWSDSSGVPSFRNGTGAVGTLLLSGGALGTPSSGTLTNCTIPASAITGTTLASNVVTSSLTSVGTLTSLGVTGTIIAGGSISSTGGNFYTPNSGAIFFGVNSRISSSSNGTVQFRNNANTADASLTAAGLTLTGTPLAAGSGGTGLTSLGTGVATFLQTPTSANLAAAVTGETGTGALVFATSPTLTTPVLGDATGTTLSLGTTLPAATICNVYSAGSSATNTWRGRMTVGGDTCRFLMGEINGQAWLGAHNAALSAWNDFYINPDGTAKVGIGDLGGGSGNVAVPILSIDNANGLSTFGGPLALTKTITAAGTTGAQTINKTSGSVNMAAGATSLTVTNSLCMTSSVVVGMLGTNDATANGLRIVVGTGSFTIYLLVAPTAETRVNWILTN